MAQPGECSIGILKKYVGFEKKDVSLHIQDPDQGFIYPDPTWPKYSDPPRSGSGYETLPGI